MRPLRAIVLAAFLAGCMPYGLVAPQRTVVKDEISVEPGLAWSRVNPMPLDGWDFFTPGPVERWTVDGERLETITFLVGVAAGEGLFRIAGEKDENQPKFDPAMTASEVMDLFEAAFAKASKTPLTQGRNLRPARLGDVDGFRFEMSYALKDEIDRELSVAGAVRDGKLYLLAYQGARLHHYRLYLPEFEKLLTSLRFATVSLTSR
jgi:hypothetical protein